MCCLCFIMVKNYSTSASLSCISRHVFHGLFSVSDFPSWICIFSETFFKLHGTKPSPAVSLYCHFLYFHYGLVQIVNIREMQNKTAILHEMFVWLDMVELIQGTVSHAMQPLHAESLFLDLIASFSAGLLWSKTFVCAVIRLNMGDSFFCESASQVLWRCKRSNILCTSFFQPSSCFLKFFPS